MNSELISRTADSEISLVIEPIGNKVMGLKVRLDGVTKAGFDLAMVWDFLKAELQHVDEHFLGMERRAYEAKNIYRLTQEWIDTKLEEE